MRDLTPAEISDAIETYRVAGGHALQRPVLIPSWLWDATLTEGVWDPDTIVWDPDTIDRFWFRRWEVA